MIRLIALWRELGRAQADAIDDDARDQLIDFVVWIASALLIVIELAIACAIVGASR